MPSLEEVNKHADKEEPVAITEDKFRLSELFPQWKLLGNIITISFVACFTTPGEL